MGTTIKNTTSKLLISLSCSHSQVWKSKTFFLKKWTRFGPKRTDGGPTADRRRTDGSHPQEGKMLLNPMETTEKTKMERSDSGAKRTDGGPRLRPNLAHFFAKSEPDWGQIWFNLFEKWTRLGPWSHQYREGPFSSQVPCQIHTYIHTYVRTYIHTYIHTYIRTYIRTRIHACMQAYMHT